MNRRTFLGWTPVGLAAGDVLASTGGQRTTRAGDASKTVRRYLDEKTGKNPFSVELSPVRRPHIFFITMDMVSPDFYLPSRALYHQVNLPTIRSITREGVAFHNAFCAVPLCAPSRSGYLTGRYPYVLGNGERAPDGLETELRPDDVIFPEYLKAVGYTTKHAGKCHVGTKKFIDAFGENDNPWNRWAPPIRDDEIYLAYLRRLGIQQQRYSREIVGLEQDRKTPGNSLGGWIEQANGKPFPLEGQYTYYLVQRAIGKIDSALEDANTKSQPIYLQLDIFDPHQPLSVPDGFEERERALRAEITLPATYEKVRSVNWATIPSQPEVYDVYRKYWGLYNPETLHDYLTGYALQMEVVDRSLAALVHNLKQRGLYDEAVIVLASDHGEMSGRWGIVDKGVYLYPDVVRAPLIVKMPHSWGVRPHAVEAPVSLLDIGPTLLDIVGVSPEARLDGKSVLPIISGREGAADRDLIFTAGWHVGVNFAAGTQMWEPNGRHFLYSYNISSKVDELYDLNSSDAENLAYKREYASVRHTMVNRLGKLLQQDPRWLGYWSTFRIDHFFDLPRVAGDEQMAQPR